MATDKLLMPAPAGAPALEMDSAAKVAGAVSTPGW